MGWKYHDDGLPALSSMQEIMHGEIPASI
jgi:hypothetical protein